MGGVIESQSNVYQLLKEYFASKSSEHLRFGQWVMCHHIELEEPWPELFYCEDITKSCQLVQQWYDDKIVDKDD